MAYNNNSNTQTSNSVFDYYRKRNFNMFPVFRLVDNQHSLLEIILVFNKYNNYTINLVITPINPKAKGRYSDPLPKDEKQWFHRYEIWMQMSNAEVNKFINHLTWFRDNQNIHQYNKDFIGSIEREYGVKSIEYAKRLEDAYMQNNQNRQQNVKEFFDSKSLYIGTGSMNSDIVDIDSNMVPSDFDAHGNMKPVDTYQWSIALYLKKSNLSLSSSLDLISEEGYFHHILPEVMTLPDNTEILVHSDLNDLIVCLENCLKGKASPINAFTDKSLRQLKYELTRGSSSSNSGGVGGPRPEQHTQPGSSFNSNNNGNTGLNIRRSEVAQSSTYSNTNPPNRTFDQGSFASAFNGGGMRNNIGGDYSLDQTDVSDVSFGDII